jgi:4-amino-4-deoxy-L-arabinose transferase-like glycosyltransferase
MDKVYSTLKNPYFILISLCLFFYLFRLGSYGFVEWDEPFYSSRALMVVQYGDFIDQSEKALGGLWTGAHPPLVIWMMAASIKLFGVSEYGFRFPIAISGIILVIFFYRLVLLLFNKK